MKLSFLAGVSALVFSAATTSVHAAEAAATEAPASQDLWYVSLFGGASFPNKMTTGIGGDDTYGHSVDFDTGFTIGAAIGRRINDAFRIEGELSYARYGANSFIFDHGDHDHGPFDASGDLSATYLLANAWVDVASFGQAKVYAGGGIGAAYVTADTSFDEPDFGYGSGGWGFAGQVGAGITYAVASNIDLDFGYRFKAVKSVDFDIDGDAENYFTDGNLYAHSLQLGMTAKF